MVTCNIDPIKKMDRPKRNSGGSGSTSSGFRLLDDHCDTVSSISRNSIYKLKIDSMFDDNRWALCRRIIALSPSESFYINVFLFVCFMLFIDCRSIASHRLDERSSVRNRRLLPSSASVQSSMRDSRKFLGGGHRGSFSSTRSSTRLYHQTGKPINITTTTTANIIEYGVECVSNKVQEQIERMFSDVADESTCSFPVRCLGSMPLESKVTSLVELQEPLRKLYLAGVGQKVSVGAAMPYGVSWPPSSHMADGLAKL